MMDWSDVAETVGKIAPAGEIPLAIARESLAYDPESGCLLWKERPRHHFATLRAQRVWNAKYPGCKAGFKNKSRDGFTRLSVSLSHCDGRPPKKHLLHRVVWAVAYNEQPPKQIDHIDGNPFNNRLDNLRDGSGVNELNKARLIRNISGVTGVSWDESRCMWRARVQKEGKTVFLGHFLESDLDLAAMEVLEARQEQGFSRRHGIDLAEFRNIASA